MSKVCLKCGYERQASDDFPEWGCPQCGAVYAKVNARSVTPKQPEPQCDPVESEKKTKNCPFCGEEILAVAIKCKHCGSMLAATAPVPPSSKKGTGSKNDFLSGDLTVKETAIVILGLIVFVVAFASLKEEGSLDKLWAHLIAPFDSKPEIRFLEMGQNPEEIDKKKEELCAWSKREELRNPSPLMSAAREGVCK